MKISSTLISESCLLIPEIGIHDLLCSRNLMSSYSQPHLSHPSLTVQVVHSTYTPLVFHIAIQLIDNVHLSCTTAKRHKDIHGAHEPLQ